MQVVSVSTGWLWDVFWGSVLHTRPCVTTVVSQWLTYGCTLWDWWYYPLITVGDGPRLVRVVSLNKLQPVLSHICDNSPLSVKSVFSCVHVIAVISCTSNSQFIHGWSVAQACVWCCHEGIAWVATLTRGQLTVVYLLPVSIDLLYVVYAHYCSSS